MEERGTNELEVRAMLQHAAGYQPDHVPGRFVIRTTRKGRTWQVIVEPDEENEVLVVITTYSLE